MSVSAKVVLTAEDVFAGGLSDHLPQAFDVAHEHFPAGIALFNWNVMGRCISWSRRQARAAGSPKLDEDSAPVTNNGLDLDEDIHEYEERMVSRVAPVVGMWIASKRPPQAWLVCLQEAPAHPGILADTLGAVASAAGLARDSLLHAEIHETASTSTVTLWDAKMWDMRLSACMAAHKGQGDVFKKIQEPLRPPQEIVGELFASTPAGQVALVVGDLNFDVRQVGTLSSVPGLQVMSGCVANSTIYQGSLLTSDALLVALGRSEQGESLVAIPEPHRGPLAGRDRESYIQQNIHHNLQARVRTLTALSDADLELLGAHHFSDQPVKLQEWLRRSGLCANTVARHTPVAPALPSDVFGKAGRQAYLLKSVHRRLQARAAKLGDGQLWLLGQAHFKDQFNEIDKLLAAKSNEPESNEDAARRFMGLPVCSLPFAPASHGAQQVSKSVNADKSQVQSSDMDVSWEAPPPCARELVWSEEDRSRDVVREKVSGLTAWLQDLNLTEYADAACTWCEDMGAITLEEVRENADDLSDFLGLKPLERRRLLRAASTLPPT